MTAFQCAGDGRYLVAGAPGDFRDYVRLVTASSATRVSVISAQRCAASGSSWTKALRGHDLQTPESAAKGSVPLNIRVRSAPLGSWPNGSILRIVTSCLTRRRQRGLQHRILRRQSQLSATILDFPETVDTAKRYAREAGLADRISISPATRSKSIAGWDMTSSSCPISGARSGRLISPCWRNAPPRPAGGRSRAAPRLHGRRRSGRSGLRPGISSAA